MKLPNPLQMSIKAVEEKKNISVSGAKKRGMSAGFSISTLLWAFKCEQRASHERRLKRLIRSE